MTSGGPGSGSGFLSPQKPNLCYFLIQEEAKSCERVTAETAQLFPERAGGDGCVTEQVIFTEKKNGRNPFLPIE